MVKVNLIRKVFNTDPFPDIFLEKEASPPLPPLVMCMLGDIRTVERSCLEPLMDDTRCIYLNVEHIGLPPVPTTKDESGTLANADLEAAGEAVAQLKAAIQSKVDASVATGNPAPLCVVHGFPIQVMRSLIVVFDRVLRPSLH